MLAEDQVDQLAAHAQQTKAATADFDDLTDGVHCAHVATTEPRSCCNRMFCATRFRFRHCGGLYGRQPRPAYSDCAWSNTTAARKCDWMTDLWGAGSWYNFVLNPYLVAIPPFNFRAWLIYYLFAPPVSLRRASSRRGGEQPAWC